MDVVATGLPLYGSRALFCDATLRSPLHADGTPHGRAAAVDGVVLKTAEEEKERKYEDLLDSSVGKLLTLGAEVGGRWNETAETLVRQLAAMKVRNVPRLLRRSAQLAWADWWWAILGVAVQDALAASILAPAGKGLVLNGVASQEPTLEDVFDAQRWE